MANMCLVHPDYRGKVFETLSVPLGLAYIAAVLEENGHNVVCYDLALEPEKEEIFLSQVENNKFDIIGVQMHSIETLSDCISLVHKIKALNPEVLVIAGGYAATLLWSKVLGEGVDIVVLREGEFTFQELADLYDKHYGSIKNRLRSVEGIAFRLNNDKVKTRDRDFIQELDKIPLPAREKFPVRKYPQWSIVTSRGCPFRCIFCTVPVFWKGSFRYRSAENVLKEIMLLKNKYRVKRFLFVDDTFGIPRKNIIELLNMMIKEKLDMEWVCFTRVDVLDSDLLALFKRAGCITISFGIETANPRTQRLIRKDLDLERSRRIILLAKRLGLRVRCSMIIGLPGEGRNEVLATARFLLSLRPQEIQVYPLIPYPGTPIFKNATKYGVHIVVPDVMQWCKNVLHPVVETDRLRREDFTRVAMEIVSLFKKEGYSWIPGDEPVKKQNLEYVIYTTFGPIQNI